MFRVSIQIALDLGSNWWVARSVGPVCTDSRSIFAAVVDFNRGCSRSLIALGIGGRD